MKRQSLVLLGAVIVSILLCPDLRADTQSPGQIDFGKFSAPSSGGEFVEVNISPSLIALARSFVEKQEPDVADLLAGLQSVHVAVIGVNEENRADLEKRRETVLKQLTGKSWERVVTAQKDGQDVGVFMKIGEHNAIQGVVVMVMDGKDQAVFVNVVGDIKPEKLALLGEKLHIDPLKKLGKVTAN